MVIVNLTTTLQRLYLCRICLISLVMQRRQPDRINLWLSRKPYLRDHGIDQAAIVDDLLATLPPDAGRLIHLRWVDNTGPYRKLIPMLREAGQDDIIVTADDDIFYGENWLSSLLDSHRHDDNTAVAARARSKKYNLLGWKTSYFYWPLVEDPAVLADDYIVTFGGGTVLSRSMFQSQDIEDNAFLEIAPTADDLWYSKLLRRNNIRIRVVPDIMNELNFIEHNDGLANHNLPKTLSYLNKVRRRTWEYIAGYFGAPVCGNDTAYRRIERYFQEK